MHRTQILLPIELDRRTAAAARRHGVSKGEVVRRALAEYLDRGATGTRGHRLADGGGGRDEVEALLLDDAFDDAAPDRRLSLDVDHHLYGAPRRSDRPRVKRR